MFSDIVVPLTGTAGDQGAVAAAVALAAERGSHLAVVEIVNLPLPAYNAWDLMPQPETEKLHAKLRAQGEANARHWQARLDKARAPAEVRTAEALYEDADRVAAEQARFAALTVVAGGGSKADGAAATRAYFVSLLMESGRPVLVVPPKCQLTMPLKKVVVAWKPSREATRAVNDAMPLLSAASSVDVVLVDARERDEHGVGPGDDLLAHLKRHNVKARIVTKKSRGRRVSQVLLEHTRKQEAQLLVMGGYGHSRLREWILGGVTRDLMTTTTLPIFFSH